jgi:hypothetical protein
MNTYEIAEDALLEASRLTRWHLTLIDAGVDPDEAEQIISDIDEPELERAAA